MASDQNKNPISQDDATFKRHDAHIAQIEFILRCQLARTIWCAFEELCTHVRCGVMPLARLGPQVFETLTHRLFNLVTADCVGCFGKPDWFEAPAPQDWPREGCITKPTDDAQKTC